MKYIINFIKKLIPKQLPLPLGRWRIENCNKQINNKIDLSNEDHCGPCGQYALEKIEANSNIDVELKNKKSASTLITTCKKC
jgi:hypothetical protein